jgi:polar amino acid transport system substrate-binding protein
MRRITRATAFVAALALAVTACGGNDDAADDPTEATEADTTEEAGAEDAATEEGEEAAAVDPAELDLVNEGTLTVCSDIPYPPFEFEDSSAPSGYSGFDIDLVQEIADRLGLELEVLEVGFDGLQSGATLAAGQCDLAASAMTITEERAQNLAFSDPYYDSLQSLVVLADSDITSLEDVAGQSIGVQRGTTGAMFAQENAPDDTEIIEFSSGPDLFTAMQAGQIVAGLQDLPVNIERVEQDENFQIVAEFDTGEQYGFAAALGNDDLIDAVNAAQQEMRDDGTYDEFYERYFSVD